MTLRSGYTCPPDLLPPGAASATPATENRTPMQVALLLTILAHVVALYLSLPATRRLTPTLQPDSGVRIRPLHIPPPPEPTQPVRPPERPTLPTRPLLPVPDLTPDDLEPIRETSPEMAPIDDPSAVAPLPLLTNGTLDIPELNTRRQPGRPGIDGVSQPVRTGYVIPTYPPMARQAGIAARVHLRAVVSSEGEVVDLEILACSAPNLGFEEAALEAVRQWRYQPGEQNGRPVDVYFTIEVKFTLR